MRITKLQDVVFRRAARREVTPRDKRFMTKVYDPPDREQEGRDAIQEGLDEYNERDISAG